MRIELFCTGCASSRFAYPLELKDDATIKCADCGHEIGTVADVQQKVMAQLGGQKAA